MNLQKELSPSTTSPSENVPPKRKEEDKAEELGTRRSKKNAIAVDQATEVTPVMQV